MGQAQIIGTVFVFFGLSSSIVSTIIDFWCYAYSDEEFLSRENGYALYFGLWELCKKYHEKGRIVTDCATWLEYRHDNEIPMGWLQGCQVMMIFGIWLYGSAFISAVVCIRTSQQTRASAYLCALAGICCSIASFLFAANMDHVVSAGAKSILHAGFGLAVSSVVFGLVAIYFLWRHTPVAGYQNVDVF